MRFAGTFATAALVDEAPSALTLLARQRSRDGEVDARPRLDELLPARAAGE